MKEENPKKAEEARAWIETIAPDAAQDLLAQVYRGISGSTGEVANILRSQSLHPEGLREHYSLYRTLMFGSGALSRAEREAIAVAVSRGIGCRY
jgi:alkylhydroperoxidase family enzyme